MVKKIAYVLLLVVLFLNAGCIEEGLKSAEYPKVSGDWDFKVVTGNGLVDAIQGLASSVTFLKPDSDGNVSGQIQVIGFDPVNISGGVTVENKVTLKYEPVIYKLDVPGYNAKVLLKLVSTLNGTVDNGKMSGTGTGSTKIVTENNETDPIKVATVAVASAVIESQMKQYAMTTSAITWSATKK